MQSRNINHIAEIDHLRLLAALLVFSFHFFHIYVGNWQAHPQMPYLGLIIDGYTGVTLFFVLSGFIFMLIASSSGPISYATFMRNRVLRIVPLFVVVFVVAISIGRDRFKATDLLYLLVTNLGDAPTSWHIATGPAWSISVEFCFYLIFPFLASFTKQRGAFYLVRLIAIIFMIKVTAYLAVDNSKHMLYSTLIGRLDQFIIGMLAALLYTSQRDFLKKHATVILPAATVLVLVGVGLQARYVSHLSPDPKQLLGLFWGTIEATYWAALVVAYVAASPRWPQAVERLIRTGGTWSYSFYMLHAMIIFSAHEAFGRIGGHGWLGLLLNGLIVLAVTFFFAGLSFSTIERPFLEMRRRYVGATGQNHET